MERHINTVNRCRPGFGASCSFCCGSHNYVLGEDEIEEIFSKRTEDFNTLIPVNPFNPINRVNRVHPEDSLEEKLIKDGMQCSYIGIEDYDDNAHLCCLIYAEDHEGKAYESFISGTCRSFLCAAWDELTDREVLFAAELMKDWYYYSLFINSTELVTKLCAEYSSPKDIGEDTLDELKTELRRRLLEEDMING